MPDHCMENFPLYRKPINKITPRMTSPDFYQWFSKSNSKFLKLECIYTVRPWRPKLNSEIVIFSNTKSLRNNKIKFLDLSELKGEE